MANGKTLPPLPASDEKSISSNRFDPFYKIRAREFWENNEISSETPEKFKKCKHNFILKAGTAECTKCSFGLLGLFEIRKGKLYHKSKAIEF